MDIIEFSHGSGSKHASTLGREIRDRGYEVIWTEGYVYVKLPQISKTTILGINLYYGNFQYSQKPTLEKLQEVPMYRSSFPGDRTIERGYLAINDKFFGVCSYYDGSYGSDATNITGVFADPVVDNGFFMFSYRLHRNDKDAKVEQNWTSWYGEIINEEENTVERRSHKATDEIVTFVPNISYDNKFLVGHIFIRHPQTKEYITVPHINPVSITDKNYEIFSQIGNLVIAGDYLGLKNSPLVGRVPIIVGIEEGDISDLYKL